MRIVLIFFILSIYYVTYNNADNGVTGCPDHSIKLYETQLDGELLQKPVWIAPDYTTVLVRTKASVYRSLDSGRNWQKLDLGNETLVQRVIATKDGKLALVVGTETRLWSSQDNGKTFQLITLPGYFTNYKLHPLQSGWILATRWIYTPFVYSQLYLSQDYGHTWNVIRTYIWDYDWHGVSDDPNMIVVYEKVTKQASQTGPPYAQRLVRTTDFFKTELTVATEVLAYLALERHIFIAKVEKGSTTLFSSQDQGESFNQVRFPLSLEEQSYTILDDTEGSTFINVRHARTNWGNLYDSNSLDTDFTLSLERNPRSYRGECDFRRMKGLDGIYIANTFQTLENERGSDAYTMITYDMGGKWQRLPVPTGTNCTSDKCNLNLLGATRSGTWYSKKEAIGLIIGTGNPGEFALDKQDELSVFFSRDAGWTWEYITDGIHTYEITNRGAIMVMSPVGRASNEMRYTLNEGKTWNVCNFSLSDDPFEITEIEADPKLKTALFLVYGRRDDNGVIVSADFTGVHERECKGHDNPDAADSDYEFWEPSDQKGDECLLGRRVKYVRRKREAECINAASIDHDDAIFVKNCTCTEEDYECDYCYKLVGDKCEHDTEGVCENYDPHKPPSPCNGVWYESQGYRLIPGDTCDVATGLNRLPVQKLCPVNPVVSPTGQPVSPATPNEITPQQSAMGGSSTIILVVLALSISFGCVFVGTWWLSGRNATLREYLLKFVPENLLPEFKVPGVAYSTLDQTPLSEDDLQEDAPELDLDNHDETTV